MTLYNEQPIEKFTLDEIAAGAGTTVQTILRIFGSKEDLLLDALSEMVADEVALKITPSGDIPVAATDVYVWKLLRGDRGVGRAAAEAVVRRLVEGITHQQMSEGSHSVAELVGRREPAG